MGLYSKFLMAFTRSSATVPIVHHVVVPLDRRIFTATKGRMSLTHLGSSLKRHVMQDLLLTTTGAKSGKQRSTPVLFLDHDGGYVIVGSRYGTDSHPHWSANLLANPAATVLVRGHEQRVNARRITGAELQELWPRLLEIYPNWADYRERTDREFRAFHLTPAA
jgi:deazaflavin-dependent oxidoreductase (nitroreductase family)